MREKPPSVAQRMDWDERSVAARGKLNRKLSRITRGARDMSDDLIERLERIRDKYSMVHDEYDSITKAAAEIHTARDSLHAVYLYGSYDGAAKERAARDAAVQAEVAAVVAWLRTRWRERPDFLADMIECGQYKKTSAYVPVADSDGDDGA